MRVRTYGTSGPFVIVLHGGPAAAGEAAPIACGLAGSFRVLEPWQRGGGKEPLTVARHIADLHAIVEELGPIARPALVGESWGAMLALAYAAAHPESAGPLVLIGCGTFDEASRAHLMATIDERMNEALRKRLEELPAKYGDPTKQLEKRYELLQGLYEPTGCLVPVGSGRRRAQRNPCPLFRCGPRVRHTGLRALPRRHHSRVLRLGGSHCRCVESDHHDGACEPAGEGEARSQRIGRRGAVNGWDLGGVRTTNDGRSPLTSAA
ncbi:MAG: alpha/beta hydrolase [Planctomycetota bacterium]